MTKSVIITTSWDDGHPLDQRIADLLAKYGLTGTFYIPVKNSRPVMNAKEIQRLSENFEVGAHTVNHVVLTEVSDKIAEHEIRESKKRLGDLTGTSVDCFCFPKGQFRRRHLDMVRRAGFRCARTVELLSTRFPVRRAGLFIVPTTVQTTLHHWTAYVRNCAKRLDSRNMANFILYGRGRNWTEIARSMVQVVGKCGGAFHLWGHSWEIEEQQQWLQLDSILRELRELRGTVPCACITNSGLITFACADSNRMVGANCSS